MTPLEQTKDVLRSAEAAAKGEWIPVVTEIGTAQDMVRKVRADAREPGPK